MSSHLIKNVIVITFWVNVMGYREERTFLDLLLPISRLIRTSVFNELDVAQNNVAQARSFSHNPKLQEYSSSKKLPCNLNITLRSQEVPTNVNKIRPGDIDVVAAMGDSITAGYGIFDTVGLINTLYEARGAVFSIGGQETWETILTLPNLLKLYNPKLYGYSLHSVSISKGSKFNVAEGGAISENMPYMAKVLVDRIKNDPKVDVEKQWKMVTIFIGHNDFCTNICYTTDYEKFLREHEADMLEVLRILKKNLPRSIINILPLFDIKSIVNSSGQGLFCTLSRIYYCPCLVALQYQQMRSKYFEVLYKWQKLDLAIADYPEFHTENFTVIGHPFTTTYNIPTNEDGNVNYNYIGPDCFHLSQRAHAKVANDLWNSLFTPYENKGSSNLKKELQNFNCPSEEHPYIYTKENS
ncbi:phospholipase B1, membrane-associated-like [Rhynchophorus ferrugineus]|uniref:phospholipase B1, membrane-associated-like n=1 Tax=Rhynchophorus ferrugineus TaxID=354439 RepID=UPI003FCEDE47